MNRFHRLLLAAGCAVAPSLLPAIAADEHAGHHAAPAAASAPGPDTPSHVAGQLKAMQALHDRMARATSAEERRALLDEQMKAMQAGMAMMDAMGTGEPPAAASAASGTSMGMGMGSGHMPAPVAATTERMALMQMMLRMMVDRLSADPR